MLNEAFRLTQVSLCRQCPARSVAAITKYSSFNLESDGVLCTLYFSLEVVLKVQHKLKPLALWGCLPPG